MLTLIRNVVVHDPKPLGPRDLLLAGGRVGAVAPPGTIEIKGADVEEIAGDGLQAIPGLVDSHVHILGGGGEGGPTTRAPELGIESALAAGVTAVIGCLGTDGITRDMASLLAKARALEVEGLSTYIFSGSYELPVRTITGSVRSDLVLIDKVVGAGEIAVSDHRSAQPTFDELARLAAECRVGGMLGGKAGILHLHLGDGVRRLQLLFRIVRETEIPITQIVPTHCNRNPELLEEAIEWARQGGVIDVTAGFGRHGGPELSVAEAVRRCRTRDVPCERVTVTSDGNGSIPEFDAGGALVGLGVASQRALWQDFQALIRDKAVTVEEACRLFSGNPARVYKLAGKGSIRVGADADVLLVDDSFALQHAFARGRRTVVEGEVCIHGTFATPEGPRS